MSTYDINKFITYVEGSDAAVRAYTADPVTYVAAWENPAQASRLPTPDSGRFTDDERAALVTRDHAALYAMGAHPYMLWHFVEAVRVWTGEVTWPEMTERYRNDVRPHGVPSILT